MNPFFFDIPSIFFTVGAGLVILFLILEIAFLKMAGSSSLEISADQLDGLGLDFLGWLGLGKVPLLILMNIGLSAFVIVGFGVQLALYQIFPLTLAAWVALPLSVVSGILAMRVLGPILGGLLPKSETYAVERGSFVGHVAEVVDTVVAVSPGRSFEVRINDQYGTTHYFKASVNQPVDMFKRGERVLILGETEFGFDVVSEDMSKEPETFVGVDENNKNTSNQ